MSERYNPTCFQQSFEYSPRCLISRLQVCARRSRNNSPTHSCDYCVNSPQCNGTRGKLSRTTVLVEFMLCFVIVIINISNRQKTKTYFILLTVKRVSQFVCNKSTVTLRTKFRETYFSRIIFANFCVFHFSFDCYSKNTVLFVFILHSVVS